MSEKYPEYYDDYIQNQMMDEEFSMPMTAAYASPEIMSRRLIMIVFYVGQKATSDLFVFKISVERENEMPGKIFHPALNNDGWMKLEYNEDEDRVYAINQSEVSWIISQDGTEWKCDCGQSVKLDTGMIITVFPDKLRLTIGSIQPKIG